MSYLKLKTSAMLLISASFLGASVSALAQDAKATAPTKKPAITTVAKAKPTATKTVASKKVQPKTTSIQAKDAPSNTVNLTPKPETVELIGDNHHALTVHELEAHELVNNIDKTSMKLKNIAIQKKLADAQYSLYSSQKKLAILTNSGDLAFGKNKVAATPISQATLSMVFNKNHHQMADVNISGRNITVKKGDELPAYNIKVVDVSGKSVSLKTIKGNEAKVLSLDTQLESI